MSNNLDLIKKLEVLKSESEQDSFSGNGAYGGHEAFRTMARGWQTALMQNYKEQPFKTFSVNDIDEAIQHLQEQKERILNLSLDS
jgi:hypothetical protein